jgi:hypothetical protein
MNTIPNPRGDHSNPREDRHKRHWIEWATLAIAVLAALGSAAAAAFNGYQGWISRDTEKREIRAYVYVKLNSITFTPTAGGFGEINYNISIANSGTTPAQNVSINYSARPFEYPLPDVMWSVPNFDLQNPVRMLFKDVTANVNGRYPALPNWQNLGQNNSPYRFYLFGMITYLDVFSESHYTRFCFSFDATNNDAVRPCENQGSNGSN